MATNGEYQHRVLYNWLLHDLYTTGKYEEALALVGKQEAATGSRSEYAAYVKGLILRAQGDVAGSLAAFADAERLNPRSPDNAKQTARSLFLLGRHAAALAKYEAAAELHLAGVRAGAEDGGGKRVSRAARAMRERGDWEIWHNRGLCHLYLGDLDAAEECLGKANAVSRHDVTYLMLSKIAEMRGDAGAAKRLVGEALEFSPESPELLTTLGELYIAEHDELQAFNYLGKSLSHNPRNVDALIAASSVIQVNGDYDGALAKLRGAAQLAPNSAHLWNNVGMCFYGKGKAVAAMACLKRALFLAPFEWLVNYNLGVVHLAEAQTASAFHFLNAAVRLNPELAAGFMYLGVALSKLGDFANACTAYDQAMSLAASGAIEPQTKDDIKLVAFNYAITCHRYGSTLKAGKLFATFESALRADNEPYSIPPKLARPLEVMRARYGGSKSGSSNSLAPSGSSGGEVGDAPSLANAAPTSTASNPALPSAGTAPPPPPRSTSGRRLKTRVRKRDKA